jgi:hypothetical protein
METTNVSRKIRLISKFLGVASILASLASCDTLENDVQKPQANIPDKEIHVYSNSSSIIDLKSKIKSNDVVKLAITTQTRSGNLTNLGNGLLQYSPTAGTRRDLFGFTIYDKRNQIIVADTVVIIVEKDSTNLPCTIYPADDHVYLPSATDSTWVIDVLKNDIICGYDTADLLLSVYKPGPHFPPVQGTATVVNGRISYTTATPLTADDKIIYKLTSKRDTTVAAYGIAYIHVVKKCDFLLRNDYFTVKTDSVGTDSLFITALSNDNFCKPKNTYRYRIAQSLQGAAKIDSSGIVYKARGFAQGQVRQDTIRYEVCDTVTCKQAIVIIDFKK